MEKSKVGNVYFYESSFLKKEDDREHFHPVILDIAISSEGSPKKGVVIITKHTEQKEKDLKEMFGENSCVIIERAEYRKLSMKSMISCRIYEEDEDNLKEKDKRDVLSNEILNKIKIAAQEHKQNSQRIKRLLT